MHNSNLKFADLQDIGTHRIFNQIENCLRVGCVVRIQHTSSVAPRFSPWQDWCESCMYDGQPQRVFEEIERCREANFDQFIKLVMEDFSCHSSFAFVVHNPIAAVA
ncbi:MAG: ribulose bisphosphate carboxylase small subunit [Candidatus Thiodiazotropha sp.]